MPHQFNELLAHTLPGSRLAHGPLSLWPLFGTAGADEEQGYDFFDAARAAGTATIHETSEAGSVPRLIARNTGHKPLLLLDGEMLDGGKQNRALNLSVLIAAGTETEIPVSCVERGRWRHSGEGFTSARRTEFAALRAMRLDSISASFARSGTAESDQDLVWRSIASKSARMRTSAPTGALKDVFDSHDALLAGYRKALAPPAGACGAVYAISGKPVGLELFDRPKAFAACADRLVSGYALDAIEMQHPMDAPREADLVGEMDDIGQFLVAVTRCEGSAYDAPGMGRTLRFQGRGVFGAALEAEFAGVTRAIHVAAFAKRIAVA